ncbi:MAG: hypothetical protein JXB26_10815 [Candidatus Aminicenantes bacterium]|nr:hypothetical protein [Candidatus Aminicenantes bacterium]
MEKILGIAVLTFSLCVFTCPVSADGIHGVENKEVKKNVPQTIDELKTRIDGIIEETNIPGAAACRWV